MESAELKHVLVVAGVIEREGRLLIARRASGDALAGTWELPGGKVEPGETPQQALARELHEEFGITCRVDGFVASSRHVYPHLAIDLHAYRVHDVQGGWEVRDHAEIRWVRPAELESFTFSPADRPIVAELLRSTEWNG